MSSFTPWRGLAFDQRHGRALVVLAACLWSLAGVFIKSMELPPSTIVFYRSLFAFLFFMIFVRHPSWKPMGSLLVSMVSYTVAISAFVLANKLTTAANAIVLQYTAPVFVYLFIRFGEGKPVARLNLLTLVFAMLGVLIIFTGSVKAQDLEGVSIAIGSGFFFAVYMFNLRTLKGFNPLNLNFYNNFACVLALLPVVSSQLILEWDQVLALGIMGVVQLAIPYFLFSKGLETVSLEEAALIVLIEPVLNPILVAGFVGEVPHTSTLLGGSLILGSLAIRYLAVRSP